MLKKFINTDFIDTSESYSDKLLLGSKNSIVIPYIGLDLLPSNPVAKNRIIVDYSYFVFISISSIVFKSTNLNLHFKHTLLNQPQHIVEDIMVGGYKNDNAVEVEIKCEKSILYLPPNFKLGSYPCPFMPIDTPNFTRNMDIDEVEAFFDFSSLPSELQEILGENIYATSVS